MDRGGGLDELWDPPQLEGPRNWRSLGSTRAWGPVPFIPQQWHTSSLPSNAQQSYMQACKLQVRGRAQSSAMPASSSSSSASSPGRTLMSMLNSWSQPMYESHMK